MKAEQKWHLVPVKKKYNLKKGSKYFPLFLHIQQLVLSSFRLRKGRFRVLPQGGSCRLRCESLPCACTSSRSKAALSQSHAPRTQGRAATLRKPGRAQTDFYLTLTLHSCSSASQPRVIPDDFADRTL